MNSLSSFENCKRDEWLKLHHGLKRFQIIQSHRASFNRDQFKVLLVALPTATSRECNPRKKLRYTLEWVRRTVSMNVVGLK